MRTLTHTRKRTHSPAVRWRDDGKEGRFPHWGFSRPEPSGLSSRPLPNTAHTLPPCAPSNDAMMVMTSAFPHWDFYAPSLASSPWVLMTSGLLTGAQRSTALLGWDATRRRQPGGGANVGSREPMQGRLIVVLTDLIGRAAAAATGAARLRVSPTPDITSSTSSPPVEEGCTTVLCGLRRAAKDRAADRP